MPKIFISYRRSDSRAFSDRIYDRLVAAFGDANVFQDVDNIPAGADFRKVLQREIQKSDVVLVIIGPHWADAIDESGLKRLQNPADFVRIEVESALSANKYVIPVLIDGVRMPPASELPVELHELLFRNAASVRHNPDFKVDMEKLIRVLQERETSTTVSEIIEPPSVDTSSETSLHVTSSKALLNLSDLNDAVRRHLLAPFEWCFVPGGSVMLETKPPKSYEVSDFVIAKYPITNAQYQVFFEARDGYTYEKDFRWYNFSEESREYRLLNAKPRVTAFMGDNLPRTNLTWFDAIAFCRWLSHKTNYTITLPTEQAWQRAAIGDSYWQYPWGNEYDVNRANTQESGIGHPVEVTEYPDGASPYGVFQMSGNVYDWCLNNYDDPNDTKLDSVVSERAVRGGSWTNIYSSTPLVTHRRDAKPSSNTNKNVGFRLAIPKLDLP